LFFNLFFIIDIGERKRGEREREERGERREERGERKNKKMFRRWYSELS
jgi:hypothetical protein